MDALKQVNVNEQRSSGNNNSSGSINFLQVSQISKQEGDFLLKDISFTQQKFQKMAIAGETGSGKSTLLKIIAGLIQPDSGEVLLEQERIKGPEEQLMPGHPGIAYLSQHFELRNHYRVEEELAYTNHLSDEDAQTIFEVCQIDHLLKRWTHELSGGEKQRIVTARLLIASPQLLLLDEPFSNLDPIHRNSMKAVIQDISDKLQITCILVSHDPLAVLSWADEILVLKGGAIIQKGSPEQIYRQPANEYVAGLFGEYNVILPEQSQIFTSLPGIKSNRKKMLIRPEHFTITVSDNEVLEGKVLGANFFGSYYEIEVLLSNLTITVKTDNLRLAKGDRVSISLSPENVWYV